MCWGRGIWQISVSSLKVCWETLNCSKKKNHIKKIFLKELITTFAFKQQERLTHLFLKALPLKQFIIHGR